MTVLCALLGAAALAAASGWSTPRAPASGTANGDFIIRCTMTGEVQQLDPIEDPGQQVASGYKHMFFGNNLSGAGVQSRTTYTDLNNAANATTAGTSCQDSKDTAAYWAPESFMPGGNAYDPTKPAAVSWYLPGCTSKGGTGINYTCGTDTDKDIYVRAYYLTAHAPAVRQLPPGTVMISGTPDAAGPSGATRVTPQTAIYWDCGTNTIVNPQRQKVQEQTPESTWPYDCSPGWSGVMPPSEQGLDEHINFPSCWDGQSSFPSPNGSGPNGTGNMVPYYLPAPAKIGGVTYTSPGDLNFPDPATGQCDTAPWTTTVPHVSIRIHYQLQTVRTPSSLPVDPSSCDNVAHLSVTCTTEAAGPTGAPSNIALQLSSAAAGGSAGGWWTEHADYWQAWQQGAQPGTGGVVVKEPGTGTLNSLTYYCLVNQQTCSFITNKNYPPPPA